MRQMIKRTIAMAGLDVNEVYEAANGIEAFAELAQHDVAVVILDINMPVMNGVQFLTRMHDDPRLCNVPVVIASTEGSETRIQQLVANGARGYLRKPFHPEQLRDTLAPLIGAREEETPVGDVDGDDATF
jgi:two-component system chemotaxis response regulator CheY